MELVWSEQSTAQCKNGVDCWRDRVTRYLTSMFSWCELFSQSVSFSPRYSIGKLNPNCSSPPNSKVIKNWAIGTSTLQTESLMIDVLKGFHLIVPLRANKDHQSFFYSDSVVCSLTPWCNAQLHMLKFRLCNVQVMPSCTVHTMENLKNVKISENILTCLSAGPDGDY